MQQDAATSSSLGQEGGAAEEEELLGEQSDNPDFKSGFVSILGNPNVGKSTLMNALLGERLCIVSPKPQTTRHRILGVLSSPSYQLVFSDTPGMLTPNYKLQEAMMDSVRGAAGDADVVLLVSDVYGEPLVDEKVLQKLQVTNRPVLVIINKVDLLGNVSTMAIPPGLLTLQQDQGQQQQQLQQQQQQQQQQQLLVKPRKRLLTSKREREAEAAAAAAAAMLNNNKISKRKQEQVALEAMSSSLLSKQYADDLHRLQVAAAAATSNNEEDEDGRKQEETNAFSEPRSLQELSLMWAQRLPRAKLIPISAAQDFGIEKLLQTLVDMTPKGPKYFPSNTLTNRDERFFASEIIRESLLHCYKDEVPYSCEVVIDSFTDKPPNLSVIEAAIIVSRESQKVAREYECV